MNWRKVPDGSQFAGFLFALTRFPFWFLQTEEVILRYYAVRVLAFRMLYDRPLNATINMEVRTAKLRYGSNLPFSCAGPLFKYSYYQLETMLLQRMYTARKFFKRWERPIRWWHRRFG